MSFVRGRSFETEEAVSTFADVECKIVQRRRADGTLFTEVLYTFKQDGVERYALTRLPYPLTDRAQEVANFKRRQSASTSV